MDFEVFQKIGRLRRDCVVTEKIDGSNAQIGIVEDGCLDGAVAYVDGYSLYAGSRNRWLQPGKANDNYGFAGWVKANASELVKLGPGRHYGEWWGLGINRGYGLTERRFSLFNSHRWGDANTATNPRPACCHVVPVLYRGLFDTGMIDWAMWGLECCGSRAAPGFMKPEGIIVFQSATRSLFKQTIDDDDISKTESLEKAA